MGRAVGDDAGSIAVDEIHHQDRKGLEGERRKRKAKRGRREEREGLEVERRRRKAKSGRREEREGTEGGEGGVGGRREQGAGEEREEREIGRDVKEKRIRVRERKREWGSVIVKIWW
ncbi:hypothetical protein TIFTF001_031747 [Ficus carica]|uniref:Uncharacterized protein n=1 Tax=Ficus carica TaxID=3494 RepID=A0AA88J4N9_FICCA|nr:hypothetical protein TIFTF001_031747 [Ficus carica]